MEQERALSPSCQRNPPLAMLEQTIVPLVMLSPASVFARERPKSEGAETTIFHVCDDTGSALSVRCWQAIYSLIIIVCDVGHVSLSGRVSGDGAVEASNRESSGGYVIDLSTTYVSWRQVGTSDSACSLAKMRQCDLDPPRYGCREQRGVPSLGVYAGCRPLRGSGEQDPQGALGP